MTDVQKIIVKVIQTVKQGWCKDQFYKEVDGEPHHDLRGAVVACVPRDVWRTTGRDVVAAIEDHIVNNTDACGMESFNDAPETKKEDVIALLKAVLADLESPTHGVTAS